MSKCTCGYECRFPGEQDMLDQYGCAKTVVSRSGPFNSLSVSMCDINHTPPSNEVEDTKDFADNFLAKYRKDAKK